ncbi:hypothetical protein BHM03_00061060, partial [Ensete ventricosum]
MGGTISVRQAVGMRTAHYRAVPPKIDRQQPIEGEKGKKKKKRKRKKKKRRRKPSAVLNRMPPPPPAGEETEHLPTR